MRGALRSRSGSRALRKRCPGCKKLRKFCEPDGNHGGEDHPRRPEWGVLDGRRVCGWCFERAEGSGIFSFAGGERTDFQVRVVRDAKTGRVLQREKIK